jgi:hypothetical protein
MEVNNFRTILKPIKTNQKIDLRDKILTIGSCFSDVIGDYLARYKFNVLANPFGTVYNPISIFNYLNDFDFAEAHYLELNEHYFHLDAHSKFFAKEKSTLSALLDIQKLEVSNYLKSANYLIITLGTSFVYTYQKSNEVVANCHKVPQSEFTKNLLPLDEMSAAFQSAQKAMQKINPRLKILLTVSPVRHIKDGMEENSVSKALLRLFCNEAATQNENVSYFPSFEIMMDDLRDYRFYKPDMIHPNEVAEEYIWDFFQEIYFGDSTKSHIIDWTKILNAMKHNPFNLASENHQKFIKSNLLELDKFANMFDVSEEKKYFESQVL